MEKKDLYVRLVSEALHLISTSYLTKHYWIWVETASHEDINVYRKNRDESKWPECAVYKSVSV